MSLKPHQGWTGCAIPASSFQILLKALSCWGGGLLRSLHPHRCVNTHVSLGLLLSRMSSTSCVLSVTPAPMCSCCASALLVPPPSKTFLKSGSQRSGDTPPPRRSSLSARSATYEKMSRWKRRILPDTHIYIQLCIQYYILCVYNTYTLYSYMYFFQTLKT